MKNYYLYNDIAETCFGDVCCAEDFVKLLDEAPNDEITIYINCFGGEVAAAFSMLAAMERHTGKIKTVVDGVAASCASWLALSGDECEISENGEFYIHSAQSSVCGNCYDMEREAENLRSYDERIRTIYSKKARAEANDFEGMMRTGTLLTAQEVATIWNVATIPQKKIVTNKTKYKEIEIKCKKRPETTEIDDPDFII